MVGKAGPESSLEATLLFGTWYLVGFLAFAFAYKFHILYFVLIRSGEYSIGISVRILAELF